jgi:hypothetical protein
MPDDIDDIDSNPINKAIHKRIDRLQFHNDSAEAKAIAELIGDSLANATAGEELAQAIAMCEAFVDWANSLKEELEELRTPPPLGESNADYERIRQQENGHRE